MKNLKLLFSVLAVGLMLNSCSKEESAPSSSSVPEDVMEAMGPNVEVYNLTSVGGSGITGQVFFSKGGGKTNVTVRLNGVQKGAVHPSHIHHNSVAQGGGIAATLTTIKGSSGRSSTNVTKLDNGTPITWDELITFNGHVNVHLSPTQMGIIVAEGNIGSNATVLPPAKD